MDYEQIKRELTGAMYPENRYLQNKICVHLEALSKNKKKAVARPAQELLDRANELKEPYNFDKKLERPENISALFEVYRETIFLIDKELI